MTFPPVIIDDLTLTVKNLHLDVVLHPLIIVIIILIIISLIINIVYFSILTFNYLKKNNKSKKSVIDLYDISREDEMINPGKNPYLRL